MKDHRKYIPWYAKPLSLSSMGIGVRNGLANKSDSLYVYNKVDSVSIEFLDQLAREPHTAVMSCELDLAVQDVVERIWKELRLMRVYTKRYVHSRLYFYIVCQGMTNLQAERELSLILVKH